MNGFRLPSISAGRRRVAAVMVVGIVTCFIAGAGAGRLHAWSSPTIGPDPVRQPPTGLTFTADDEEHRQLTSRVAGPTGLTSDSSASGTGRVPVEPGTPTEPFSPLPDDGLVRAVRTGTGLTLPVVARGRYRRDGQVLALTACEDTVWLALSEVETVGRAHVVLDPGHGGTETGAVGSTGLTEKDINLVVASATRRLLEEAGATVIMTRESDHNLTTATRGRLAAEVKPGLFVSIHHNGGAPPSGDQPGVMAFTKADSPSSDRFGGLFYHRFNALLAEVAATRAAELDQYRQVLDDYGAEVADYDRRVAAWRAASTTTPSPDGQPAASQSPATTVTAATAGSQPTTVPSTSATPTSATPTSEPSTTVGPATTMVDGVMVPVARAEVPDVGPPPSIPDAEPVRELRFAGGGNRGVRSWIRPDGRDYLSVLRTSEHVPAVLAEFLYLTNPAEEELLLDPGFVDAQAQALTDAIVDFFSGPGAGTTGGYVDDQFLDQPIGGGGRPESCVEPPLTGG